jgi:hypothetical protein
MKKKTKWTRLDTIEALNAQGIPENHKASNAGSIPDHWLYGSWLYKHNPKKFEQEHGLFRKKHRGK